MGLGRQWLWDKEPTIPLPFERIIPIDTKVPVVLGRLALEYLVHGLIQVSMEVGLHSPIRWLRGLKV